MVNLLVEKFISSITEEHALYKTHCASIYAAISSYIRNGIILESLFKDKVILDLECGMGGASQIFYLLGAKRVIGLDFYLPDALSDVYPKNSRIEYRKCDFLTWEPEGIQGVDFIFLHNASEHIQHPAQYIEKCYSTLVQGGGLFIAHDNYYQPVGHHDHNFLFLSPSGDKVETVSPKCWLENVKCEYSRDFRLRLAKSSPPVWSANLDNSLDPKNCHNCCYYIRSQPWAHLLYQNNFNNLFPFPIFKVVNSGYLNKITIRQLRQYCIEAGFFLEYENNYWLQNEVPQELLADYAKHDLLTFQYFLRLVRN